MFGPTKGFSEMADSKESCKMLWGGPCCHGNEILANLAYFSQNAYKLACMPDRPAGPDLAGGGPGAQP